MSLRKTSEPTIDEHGSEVHPAFGLIGVYSTQSSPPGAVLFDSDIRHQHTMVVKIHAASRKRDISRDWLHGRRQIFEVEMSQAQWAAFVSSTNSGSGVPCTIRMTPDNYMVDGVPFDPRLAHSMQETHDAAEAVFEKIKEALAAYEEKKTAANLRTLHYAIHNATSSVDYVGKTLVEHTDAVVQKAKADIEAFVAAKAAQYPQLSASDISETLQITGDVVDAEEVGG